LKKIISFSLYGNDPKYTIGALCNAELRKEIYPDWICRFYCGLSVPNNIIEELSTFNNTEIIMMDETQKYSFMMWRFLPMIDDDVSVFISRDCDSRLSLREKKCVDIFMESDYMIHSIQDNINHPDFMGGMWGLKKYLKIDLNALLDDWKEGNFYDSDQQFLRQKIVPLFGLNKLIHCSTIHMTFPIEPTNEHFVGEVFPSDNYGKPYNYIFY